MKSVTEIVVYIKLSKTKCFRDKFTRKTKACFIKNFNINTLTLKILSEMFKVLFSLLALFFK